MSLLANMTIKHKLIAIIMLTSITALLLTGFIFVLYERSHIRHDMAVSLSTQAEIIADNCKAALAFEDAEDAKETLHALHVESSIVFACIYTSSSEVFATYCRDDDNSSTPSELQQEGYSFSDGFLTVFKPIVLDGETIGTVCLRSDLQPMQAMVRRNTVIIIAIVFSASLVAYLVSSRLQGIISRPILSLADVAKVVSEKKDYSVRALKRTNDEIGLLIDAFNEMLEQIQQRDSALVGAKEQLEIKVKERTAELSSANAKLEVEVEQRSQAQKNLRERIKEVSCLYDVSKLLEQPKNSLEQIFQETVNLLRKAYLYPDKTCVRITFNGIHYTTDNFDKSELSQYAIINVRGDKVGSIEVYHLGEKPETGQEPFLKEERALLDTVAEHLGRIAERHHAREKLQLFRNLIDRSNDGIFVVEPKWGRFLDVNNKACDYLGYTRQELLDMTVKDIDEFITDDSAWTERANQIREEDGMIFESAYKRKDDTTFPAEINVKFIDQGEKSYLLAIARDITERKKAEEKLKQAAEEWITTFNSITDLVSIHDKDFKIVRANKAFADALNMGPEEIIGKTCCEIVHGTKEPPAVCPHKKSLDTKKPHRAELFEPRLGVYLEASTSPIFDENGQFVASVHIAKDITERKWAEEKQAELLDQVEKANSELKDFAHIISHDLKAPLRGIKTLADWITTDYADKLDKEGKEQMNLLSSRVGRMHNLIDGVLQYSKVGREKEEMVEVNLNELVPAIIDTLAPPENIEIAVESELPVLQCEQTRIIQVFQNLLSNAVKYMDKPQGQVRIGCIEENGFFKFSVADNGPGIEEKYFEKIFQMFQTLSPRDEFESTGVGLTVVKKIVEMYGGKIWVESEPGQGSTFTFTLPRKEMGVKNAKLETNIVSRR